MINRHNKEESLILQMVATAITESGVSCASHFGELTIFKGWHYRIGCWITDTHFTVKNFHTEYNNPHKHIDKIEFNLTVDLRDPTSIETIVRTVGEFYNKLPSDRTGRDPDRVKIEQRSAH